MEFNDYLLQFWMRKPFLTTFENIRDQIYRIP
jgi:hypothetical protein